MSINNLKHAYALWRRADGKARVAEEKLRVAWDHYARTGFGFPTSEMIADVSQLRMDANAELTQVLIELQTARANLTRE